MPISDTDPTALKNYAPFKSAQKWLDKNDLLRQSKGKSQEGR